MKSNPFQSKPKSSLIYSNLCIQSISRLPSLSRSLALSLSRSLARSLSVSLSCFRSLFSSGGARFGDANDSLPKGFSQAISVFMALLAWYRTSPDFLNSQSRSCPYSNPNSCVCRRWFFAVFIKAAH